MEYYLYHRVFFGLFRRRTHPTSNWEKKKKTLSDSIICPSTKTKTKKIKITASMLFSLNKLCVRACRANKPGTGGGPRFFVLYFFLLSENQNNRTRQKRTINVKFWWNRRAWGTSVWTPDMGSAVIMIKYTIMMRGVTFTGTWHIHFPWSSSCPNVSPGSSSDNWQCVCGPDHSGSFKYCPQSLVLHVCFLLSNIHIFTGFLQTIRLFRGVALWWLTGRMSPPLTRRHQNDKWPVEGRQQAPHR